ncbi:MAG: cytochrome C oxidase subunit IV family protein [Nitrospiraceae bacterium]|nr:cytochrome C oxidase subunit IV family protein [Nitrospiraceae bacterium]
MNPGKTEQLKTENKNGEMTYILAWAMLVALTAITVGVYTLHLGTAGVAIALVIASLKAGVILLFFMHLRQESRFLQSVFLLPVFLLGAIIGLTFIDVWYR